MLLIPVIGAVLLCAGSNLEAARVPGLDYGQLISPELRMLNEAMEHALASEKPETIWQELYEKEPLGDNIMQMFYEGARDAYPSRDVYNKLHYLNVKSYPCFKGLRSRVVLSAMTAFTANSSSQDKAESEKILKDACANLAEDIRANHIQTKDIPWDHIHQKRVISNNDLLTLVNLNSFCSIMQASNWGKQ